MLTRADNYDIIMIKAMSENRLSDHCRANAIKQFGLKEVWGVVILSNEFCDAALARPEILSEHAVDPRIFGANCCAQPPASSCDNCRSIPSRPCHHQTWTEYFWSYVV